MPEQKKSIWQQFSIGNIIAILIIVGGFASAYIAMTNHLNDETIHIDPNERVLKVEEYNRLVQWADEFETIESNEKRIIEIEKHKAVHTEQYNILFKEQDDLENKHSRDIKEIKSEIKNQDKK